MITAAREHWHTLLSSDLEQRILSIPCDESLRGALAYCALSKAPEALVRCFERLAATPETFVRLLLDVHVAQRRMPIKTRSRRIRSLLARLPNGAAEIFKALPEKDKAASAVGSEALSLLERAAEASTPSVLYDIVPVIIASGSIPSAAIRRWLVETSDTQLAKAAAEAAILIENDALVTLALDHSRADARETALVYLAARLPDPLPLRMLNFWSDPGSRVRRALVRILGGRHCAEHLSVIRKLIDDEWSDAEAFHNVEPSYPIAREAVAGLAAYGRLSDDIGEALLLRAERTDDRLLGMVADRVPASGVARHWPDGIGQAELISSPVPQAS